MSTTTVAGLFENFVQAQRVVEDLVAAGVDRDAVSLVARHEAAPAQGEYVKATDPDLYDEAAATGAGTGATAGSVLGGALGLLAGIGALAIPGIGPVIAAGTLATALGGAAVGAGVGAGMGGLIGGLAGSGIGEDEAGYFEDGVRRGGVLITAQVPEAQAETAREILRRHAREIASVTPVDPVATADGSPEGITRSDL
jgi:hypothetical protein